MHQKLTFNKSYSNMMVLGVIHQDDLFLIIKTRIGTK